MTLKLHPKTDQRVFIMSDIHGNLSLFNRILESLQFTTEDLLIINGDISEKGPNSIGLFERIIELKQTHEVYATLGNCDELLLFLKDDAKNQGMHNYMSNRKHTILSEFALECPKPFDFVQLKKYAFENYSHIFDFVEGLPLKIETPYFDVVHAGINKDNLHDLRYMLEHRNFLNSGFSFSKPLIVGHYPVCLYRSNHLSHNPILDDDLNIYSIDGGNIMKPDGQINVIQFINEEKQWFAFDELDYIKNFRTQESQHNVALNWVDNAITIVSKGFEFSSCIQNSSQKRLEILNDYIDFDNNCVNYDYTDSLIEVKENDVIHILRTTSRGDYIKCRGSVGWLMK